MLEIINVRAIKYMLKIQKVTKMLCLSNFGHNQTINNDQKLQSNPNAMSYIELGRRTYNYIPLVQNVNINATFIAKIS